MAKVTPIVVVHLVIGIVIGCFIGFSVGQINSLQGQVSSLQNQITSLESDKSSLQGQVITLQYRLEELKAIHNYTVGAVLTTLSGYSELETGPLFHIPGGNIMIEVKMTGFGEFYWLNVVLSKFGVEDGNSTIWATSFYNPGTWINYVYSLEEGDYYLNVGPGNFYWQITVYVYG